MKANRKFRGEDDAVSPVIAVILMVAITVVLAATVYVWVSGFGSQSSNPAKTMALTSAGSISATGVKTYAVASATSGLTWGDLSITLNGEEKDIDGTNPCTSDPASAAVYQPCGPAIEDADDLVHAGDTLKFQATSGDTLRILDTQANSVIFTITVG